MGHIDHQLDELDEPFIELFGYTLTINEIHAATLGLIGLVLGEGGVTLKTIRREPHYFLTVLVITYIIGRKTELHAD